MFFFTVFLLSISASNLFGLHLIPKSKYNGSLIFFEKGFRHIVNFILFFHYK